jgi:hypothetical protein
MKHINIKLKIAITGILSFGMLATSCSDFLKEEPYSFVTPEKVGDSKEAALQWTAGAYSKLLDDMARWGYFPRVLEMDNDYTSGPDWAFASMGAGNFQREEMVDKYWKGFYNLIFRADYAAYYISSMQNIEQDFKDNCIGEMRFLKAFSYFMLTRAYGNLPLCSLEESVNVMNNGITLNRSRSSIKEVYAEIIRLLAGNDTNKGAIDLMYANTDTGWTEGHASKGAAAALLAKVYVTMAAGSIPTGEQVIVRTGEAYHYADGVKAATSVGTRTFTKNAVAGYDFDWRECYTKAAEYAQGIINKKYGEYGLLPYDELWKRAFANRTEHMFMLCSVSGDEKYGTVIHRYFSGQQDGGGNFIAGPWVGSRWHWYQLFDNQDYRITKGVKHRFRYSDEISHNGGIYYPGTTEYKNMAKGYTDENGEFHSPVAPYNDGVSYAYDFGASRCMAFTTKYDDVTDPTIERTDAYWPFLRYADVLLILAEAKCELESGVSTEAINLLNEVRQRSNATLAATSGNGAITTKLQLRSAILEERAKEFAMEGDRRWDLIRWGIYLDAMNAIGGINADGSRTKYDENNIFKSRETKHLLWPLPVGEIDGNMSVTENNPGWS